MFSKLIMIIADNCRWLQPTGKDQNELRALAPICFANG